LRTKLANTIASIREINEPIKGMILIRSKLDTKPPIFIDNTYEIMLMNQALINR
jgi:hypothetical protein